MKDTESLEEIKLSENSNSDNTRQIQKFSLVEYYSLKSKFRNIVFFFAGIFISWILGNLVRISQQNSKENCPSNNNNSLCKCSFDCDNIVDIIITISMGLILGGFIYLWIIIIALCCLSFMELGISKE
jgi:uncharacterized membrane protein SpoIIM required for sporulation